MTGTQKKQNLLIYLEWSTHIHCVRFAVRCQTIAHQLPLYIRVIFCMFSWIQSYLKQNWWLLQMYKYWYIVFLYWWDLGTKYHYLYFRRRFYHLSLRMLQMKNNATESCSLVLKYEMSSHKLDLNSVRIQRCGKSDPEYYEIEEISLQVQMSEVVTVP